jgi:hypothetical protein
VVLILQKFDEDPTRRRLLAESRYTDTPQQLTFALDPGGYRVETEEGQVAERYAEVLDALPPAPEAGLTREELMAATGWKRWAVRSAIKELVLAGVVETSGAGQNHDPHRFRKRLPEEPGGRAVP